MKPVRAVTHPLKSIYLFPSLQSDLRHPKMSAFDINSNPSRSIVIIAGPGGQGCEDEVMSLVSSAASTIKSKGFSVTVVGDRVGSCSLKSAKDAVPARSTQTGDTTFIAVASGREPGGRLRLRLEGDVLDTPVSKVLETIAWLSAENHKTDVLLTVDRGALAFYHTNVLPSGSSLVALTPSDGQVFKTDLVSFFAALGNNHIMKGDNLTAQGLLDIYLLQGLGSRGSPLYDISDGEGGARLSNDLDLQIGRSFTDDQKEKVIAHLGRLLETDRVSSLMQIIETAKNANGIKSEDYGTCLAICKASQG